MSSHMFDKYICLLIQSDEELDEYLTAMESKVVTGHTESALSDIAVYNDACLADINTSKKQVH